MKLQLALDLLDLGRALEIARAVGKEVDIIEVGTPLLKYAGMSAVRSMREAFLGKSLMADMKTADAGEIEVSMAIESGADIVSVLAVAPLPTVRSAIDTAHRLGAEVMVDMIGVSDLPSRLSELRGLDVDYLLVHCGIDEQRCGRDPFADIRALSPLSPFRMAVAGGIDADTVRCLEGIPSLEIVIVGGAITKANDPRAIAGSIRSQLKMLEKVVP